MFYFWIGVLMHKVDVNYYCFFTLETINHTVLISLYVGESLVFFYKSFIVYNCQNVTK